MIKRIELKNFMSHEHTVIEPAAGLTVLIGPNNVGKSAIIAALQILCYNENSTYVMRHGAKECSVSVETDDGHSIVWRRKKSPSYEIDGQKFDRLARSGVPEELHQALRLSKVEASSSGDAFDIHFGSQKSPIFLLDQSGATAARFFASSSDAIRLVEMQQKHKDKVRDARRSRVQLDAQAKQLNLELTVLEPVVAIERRVETLEADFQQITQVTRQLDLLIQLEQQMTLQEQSVHAYETEESALRTLAAPPELAPIEPLLETIDQVVHYTESERWETRRMNAVSELTPLPEFIETQPLTDLCSELLHLKQTVVSLKELRFVLQDLISPPELSETSDLELLVTQLSETELKLETTQRQVGSLGSLAEPPELQDLEAVVALLNDLAHAELTGNFLSKEKKLLEELLPLDVKPTDDFNELVESISGVQLRVQSLERELELLSQFSPPEVSESTLPVEELLSQMESVDEEILNRSAQLKQLQVESDQVAEQIRLAAQDESCPVCGGPLNAERLIEQAGRVSE